ncbi:unannotated protein [freshwater metagenome]|uniref:Unannotated protein n=1 Tax=freshwater metagenome TaxID=449393 RepID=A0A6J6VHX6_9ZZZZ
MKIELREPTIILFKPLTVSRKLPYLIARGTALSRRRVRCLVLTNFAQIAFTSRSSGAIIKTEPVFADSCAKANSSLMGSRKGLKPKNEVNAGGFFFISNGLSSWEKALSTAATLGGIALRITS